MIALVAILAVTGATVGLGAYGVRFARTTSDLFVASRAVTPWWNAAAISGEYLSAASFLGIAGLQMKIGSGALWLPLALYLLPGLQDVDVLGVPLPLLAIVIPPFPIFVAFGWLYARRAEALEHEFRELVEPAE